MEELKEIIRIQKKMYETISLTAAVLFVIFFIFAFIPWEYSSEISKQNKEIVNAVFEAVSMIMAIIFFVIAGVFFVAKPVVKK